MLGYQIKHDALVHLILDHHSLSHFIVPGLFLIIKKDVDVPKTQNKKR